MMYDGFIHVSDGSIPFHYDDGDLELIFGGSLASIENGTSVIVGQRRGVFAGGWMKFHLTFPIENYGTLKTKDETGALKEVPISIGTLHQEVDYYIDGYEEGAKYTKMHFSFPELDYIIPSASVCDVNPDERTIRFTSNVTVIKSFLFEYKSRQITFALEILSDYKGGIKRTTQTVSRLTLQFEETDDLEFILSLYYNIGFFFSFLCNRRNIAFDSVSLIGTHTLKGHKKPGAGTIEDRVFPVSCTLYVPEKYKDAPEEQKVIEKTIRYGVFASAINELFAMILEDKVSIQSIHSSRAARNLLDLKQCLHITAAFEYYQRNFLPKISSLETMEVYNEVKALVEEYAKAQSGKKKEKAKRLAKSLSPEISLQDKICKVYDEYDIWQSLKPVLSEFFGGDISELAGVANEWRNELAHEKREFEPTLDVISAMRLMEHLNYCIVLRQAGYSDDEMKAIVNEILAR